MKDLKFTTINKAKKQVEVSYLTKTASSAKLIHSAKESNVLTTGLYLAPANQSGYQVCSHSTPECRMACLNGSGRAAMELIAGKNKISECRNVKTKLLFENQNFFMKWLISEIIRDKKVAQSKGMHYAVRLNCTSDIDWSNILYNGLNIFQIFPEIEFYDYTKNWNKFNNIAPNYHLTFSYTGKNASKAKELLSKGYNVAVVFSTLRGKKLPTKLAGYNVIDGDLTDYRPSDGKGVIVGLRFKLIAGKENQKNALQSVFIIDENNLTDNTLAKSIQAKQVDSKPISIEQLN
jgi:hypothetical protein